MPKEVIQSNWHYSGKLYPADEGFKEAYAVRMQTFELLDKHGYDQVPTGSSVWASDKNFELLTEYAVKHISPERLMGMMQTTWERIDPDWMQVHHKSAEHIKIAKAWYENRER